MAIYYKVLTDKGAAHHGGVGRWPLPNGDEPGAWKQVKGEVIPCVNGLHVCTKDQLITWLGPAIFVCEVDDTREVIDHGDKTVVRRARLVSHVETWNERTARLFAADCADRAIRLTEKWYGRKCDYRSRAAVRAAREFADGNISAAELAAAWDAARAAVKAAACDAAWAAAKAAACDAAWAAAKDAARDAAWAAAKDAAWDAARDAAKAAACDAARAAAKDAACDAAWAAAKDAAWDAERKWQTKRLFEYLDGKRGV